MVWRDRKVSTTTCPVLVLKDEEISESLELFDDTHAIKFSAFGSVYYERHSWASPGGVHSQDPKLREQMEFILGTEMDMLTEKKRKRRKTKKPTEQAPNSEPEDTTRRSTMPPAKKKRRT